MFEQLRTSYQFHENNRKNPHDHFISSFTEFLEREPFYTYFDAVAPKVPVRRKKSTNSMQHPVSLRLLRKD